MTTHHQKDATTATCGIRVAQPFSTTDASLVTCKRCLAALARQTQTTPAPDTATQNTATQNTTCSDCGADLAPATDLNEDGTPKYTDPTNGDLPLCFDCHDFVAHTTPAGKDRTPDGRVATPTPDSATDPKPTTLKDKAKAATTKAKTAPTKTAKAANVHLAHQHLNEDGTPQTMKNGEPRPGTLCSIPGGTTTDPALVTCKVCLAKLNGTKPTNAIPDRVKDARKAFRSFVARATYLAYMDSDCLGTGWTLTHTNLAGDRYQITATGRADGLYLCNNTTAGNTKASLLETIEQLEWSCGEDR